VSDLKREISQRKAKVLIRDYLRETGKKGVTSLMRDIHRHAKRPIFAQRTLEKWLNTQDRSMQDETWEVVLDFIESAAFKRKVPYANEGPAEKRLKKVADGFLALYGERKNMDGLFLLPSQIEKQGQEAIQLLDGYWENSQNLPEGDIPRTICRIEPVPGEHYAKFAYFSMFRSRQISTTGIVIYLNSADINTPDYCYNFILQLWRRRDPKTGSQMFGQLIYLTAKEHPPEFSVATTISQYFFQANESDTADIVVFRTQRNPIAEETTIIDTLLEDVLPHGYAEA